MSPTPRRIVCSLRASYSDAIRYTANYVLNVFQLVTDAVQALVFAVPGWIRNEIEAATVLGALTVALAFLLKARTA